MVFSFPSLSVFSAKDNKNQQIAFYSFSLSNYWNIFTNYRNVNVSLKPLSLSFEEFIENRCMKRIIFSISLLLFVTGMYGQARRITLEECQQKTQDNYPLVRQYDLIEKTKEYIWKMRREDTCPSSLFRQKRLIKAR